MALKTFVKVSGINNLSDARYCAGMGVNIIGFSLDESATTYLPDQKLKEIAGWISGVEIAGEFFGSDEEALKNKLENSPLKLDYVELSDSSLIDIVKGYKIPVILKVDISKWGDIDIFLNTYSSKVAFFHLTGGESLDDKTVSLFEKYPILLGYGFDQDNIENVIELPVKGIELKGEEELRPGFKDFGKLADILEALEEL